MGSQISSSGSSLSLEVSLPSDCFLFAKSCEKKRLDLKLWKPFHSTKHSCAIGVARIAHIFSYLCRIFLPPNFFDQCQTFLCKYPRTLSEKRVCPPLSLWTAQPIRSKFTSVVVSIWTSFWGRDFHLESNEMLWKRWTQSIRYWSYTPLCTVFIGLWFAVTLRWVSSSTRIRNSFEH